MNKTTTHYVQAGLLLLATVSLMLFAQLVETRRASNTYLCIEAAKINLPIERDTCPWSHEDPVQ